MKRLDTARQAQRQQGLRDRRQAAGHAERGDQGLPGVRRQARELRRGEDRRPCRASSGVVKVNDTRSRSSPTPGGARRRRSTRCRSSGTKAPNAAVSSATIAEHLKEGLTATATNGERQNGDALEAIAGAAKKVEAVYCTPFLAHACMEPMNATVRISADKAEVWVADARTPRPRSRRCRRRPACRSAKCEVYQHDLGGGFGRRGGTQDYVRQAVAIAKQFPGVPVKMIWSREEDKAHDFFRPISQCKLSRRPRRRRQPRRPARARVRPVDQRLRSTRPASSAARTGASCRASGRSPATRSSATRCRTC